MRAGIVSSARACWFAASIALALASPALASPSRTANARVPFTRNDGQLPSDVRFHAQTFGGSVFVLEDGRIRYALPRAIGDGTGSPALRDGWVLDECLSVRAPASIVGENPAQTRLSVLRGNDPALWRTGIPCFNSVALGAIDEGISVELRAYGHNVEKLFTVQPGADARRIVVAVDGAHGLCVDPASGELVLDTGLGEVRFTRPVAYQDIDGSISTPTCTSPARRTRPTSPRPPGRSAPSPTGTSSSPCSAPT
jgi:hypothetical protein